MFKELFTEALNKSNLQLNYTYGDIGGRWEKDQKSLKKLGAKIVDIRKGKAKTNSDQGSYSWIAVDVWLDPADFDNDIKKVKTFLSTLEDPNGILSKKEFIAEAEATNKIVYKTKNNTSHIFYNIDTDDFFITGGQFGTMSKIRNKKDFDKINFDKWELVGLEKYSQLLKDKFNV